ncbi:hypothetical protein LCGC14_2439100 [marine sediment metagenome]|uniref:HTH luxR-type domain-containing protein n=1 Tax=marine sediment metagenome TaxID=412755 RepID=A0A0F9C6Y6_9ZZZZ
MTVNGSAPVDHSDLHDEELVDRLSYGDVAALETLYDRYGDLVYSVALRVVRDAHLAQDISQETFLRLWTGPEKYVAQRGRFVTWLLAITRNRAVDEVRKRKRRSRYETASPEQQEREVPASDAHDPALAAQLADQRCAVSAALARLPREQRQAIELAYFGGLSNREMADLFGWPLGTVKTRIRLGVQKLRAAVPTIDKAQEDRALGVPA